MRKGRNATCFFAGKKGGRGGTARDSCGRGKKREKGKETASVDEELYHYYYREKKEERPNLQEGGRQKVRAVVQRGPFPLSSRGGKEERKESFSSCIAWYQERGGSANTKKKEHLL